MAVNALSTAYLPSSPYIKALGSPVAAALTKPTDWP